MIGPRKHGPPNKVRRQAEFRADVLSLLGLDWMDLQETIVRHEEQQLPRDDDRNFSKRPGTCAAAGRKLSRLVS